MVSDHALLHFYPTTDSNTSTGMMWVTPNMPSSAEECREPSGNFTLSGEWLHWMKRCGSVHHSSAITCFKWSTMLNFLPRQTCSWRVPKMALYAVVTTLVVKHVIMIVIYNDNDSDRHYHKCSILIEPNQSYKHHRLLVPYPWTVFSDLDHFWDLSCSLVCSIFLSFRFSF